MTLRSHIVGVLISAVFSVSSFCQGDSTIVIVGSDTMIAGQVNEMQFENPGFPQGAQLYARMVPFDRIDGNICATCWRDELFASSVTTDGSLVSAVFDVPLGFYPVKYEIRMYSDHPDIEWQGWYAYPRLVSKPYIYDTPDDLTVCYGTEALLEVKAYEPAALDYRWYFRDDPIENASGPTLGMLEVFPEDTGTYTCILSNAWGSDTVEATVDLHFYRDTMGVPIGPEAVCMGTESGLYGLKYFYGVETHNWRLEPGEAGEIETQHHLGYINWNQDFAGTARLFTELTWGECRGPNSDTLEIRVVGPKQAPDICIVGLDETTGKYRVIWNRLDDPTIVAYHVFRESNQAGVFLEIGSVSAGEPGMLIDSSSSPEVVAHSYRISYTDSCGNTSEPGAVHSTIHLTASPGTGGENHLNWSPYQGFAFLSYEIYRGTGPDDLQLFQQVSSNVTSYTDTDPPARAYYQVVAPREGGCQPVEEPDPSYSRAKSNVYELNTIGTGNFRELEPLSVYPNPAERLATVTLPGGSGEYGTIALLDLSGRQVQEYEITGNSVSISVGYLPRGAYLIKVKTESYSGILKLMVR